MPVNCKGHVKEAVCENWKVTCYCRGASTLNIQYGFQGVCCRCVSTVMLLLLLALLRCAYRIEVEKQGGGFISLRQKWGGGLVKCCAQGVLQLVGG